MPTLPVPGPFPISGVSSQSWIVRFDKNGVCTSPKTRDALLNTLAQKNQSPIIFFSHGWNNDFSQAIDLYRRFLTRFEEVLRTSPLAGPSPIFVGIIWPSSWLPSDAGPQLAAAPGQDERSSAREHFLRDLLETLPLNTDRRRLYELLETPGLSRDLVRELARMLTPALKPSDEGPKEAIAEENITNAIVAVDRAVRPKPMQDLEDVGTVAGAGTGGESPGAAGLLDGIDPMAAVRLFSLYIMKDRAGEVGATGAAALLRDMLEHTPAPIHAAGHSFGCKVMLSAIANSRDLRRPLQSLLLLQPAVSHLSFASTVPGREGPGGYRNVLERVASPIFSTYSAHDVPLHDIYHLALIRSEDLGDIKIAGTAAGDPPSAYAALGGYGPRGVDQHLIDPLPEPGTKFFYPTATKVVGFDGSQSKRIDSHGGIASLHTAWLLRSQMKT